MLAIISLLTVVVLSLLVVRIATIALVFTGLSRQTARFQARSAFTGTGFSTSESEKVVSHPVRRRIIMLLMLLGNAGFITAASSLVLTFIIGRRATGWTGDLWFRVGLLAVGLGTLWLVAHSQWVDRRLSRVIEWALRRWSRLEVSDYASLLHLAGGYAVVELHVEPNDWMANRPLGELRLNDEGILVLGIQKPDGGYYGAPRGHYRPEPDDTLVLYGPRLTLQDLDQRRADRSGNWRHHLSVERQVVAELEEDERISESRGE